MQNSPAAQIIIALIPIVGIVMGSVVIFFFLYWHHQQRILMIEKGMLQPQKFDYSMFSLFAGFLLAGVGFGLSLFFYAKSGIHYSLLSGLVPFSLGLSLLTFFVFYRRLRNQDGF